MTGRRDIFDWGFLEEVGRWAFGVACLAALVGAFVTRSWAFPLSCLLTAGIDLAIVHTSAVHGGRVAEQGGVDRGAMIVFLGGRLGYKVLLLTAAVVWPSLLDFWGVVVGALTYDTTLLVVGSWLAVDRTRAMGR